MIMTIGLLCWLFSIWVLFWTWAWTLSSVTGKCIFFLVLFWYQIQFLLWFSWWLVFLTIFGSLKTKTWVGQEYYSDSLYLCLSVFVIAKIFWVFFTLLLLLDTTCDYWIFLCSCSFFGLFQCVITGYLWLVLGVLCFCTYRLSLLPFSTSCLCLFFCVHYEMQN